MKQLFAFLSLLLVTGALLAEDTNTVKNPALSGSFQIRNKKFGDLLRPENANNANGTRIVLYSAQPWKCMTWKVQSTNSGYQLQNHFTSKTFASTATLGKSQSPVTQVPYGNPADHPTWQIEKLSDGTYKIADPKTGHVLTGTSDGVVTSAWADKDEQKWELLAIDPSKLTM
jgi:hypothetical protein